MLRGATLALFTLLGTTTSALADARSECESYNTPLDRRIVACSEVIRRDPRAAWAYVNRGTAYGRKGDPDRAIADYNTAIELDPKDADGYYNRGNAYRDKGDLDRAIADFNKAIEINPKYTYAYNNRGNAYRRKGDPDRAIADYSKAIEINPKDAGAYYSRGSTWFIKGDFSEASADFLHVIELNDASYAMVFRYLARSRGGEAAGPELDTNAGRLKTKEWPYAVIELYLDRRAPKATLNAAGNPAQQCEAQFFIGQWHVLKGNAAEAETALKAAVETCPKSWIVYAGAVAELKRLKR